MQRKRIAERCILIDQSRRIMLNAASRMSTVGNKVVTNEIAK